MKAFGALLNGLHVPEIICHVFHYPRPKWQNKIVPYIVVFNSLRTDGNFCHQGQDEKLA
jgi:hypothetical protein